MSVQKILTDLPFTRDFRLREQAIEALQQRIRESTVSERQSIAPCAGSIDSHQSAVVHSQAPTIRMVAPAGAGKTQTVINRLLQRIAQGVHPARMLMLTFDNAAVNSIKLKLQQLTASNSLASSTQATLSQMRLATLNAYGYSLLRDFFPQEFKQVLASRNAYGMIKELRSEITRRSRGDDPLPPYIASRFFLEFFGLLKNALHDPRAVDSQAFADFLINLPQATVFFTQSGARGIEKTVQALLFMYEGYERLLNRDRVIDFDDQKLRAFAELNRQPETLQHVQSLWDEVVVDEFQDINYLDFRLVEAIARRSTLVVTGDDDQAIYGFRGCSPEYIIDLAQRLERPIESYELQINYRCPPLIVEHADRLIRHNQRRIPKQPKSASVEQAHISVVSSLCAGLEAHSIVEMIKHIRAETPTLDFKDFVVLYRTNAQSLPLQIEFILNDIPYYVRKEDNILDNEHLAKFLAILRVKIAIDQGQNPEAADASRFVCSFFRYIEPKMESRIDEVLSRGGNFVRMIERHDLDRLLPDAGRDLLPLTLQDLRAARTLMETVDVVCERFRGLRGLIGGLDEVVAEKMPLGEIGEIALRFGGSVVDFVASIENALGRARKTRAGQDHKSGVPLLTYFRAKGLQWHTVILTTCNEGIIPHQRAEVEEERRLFYVAMTRASSNLILSHVQSVCGNPVEPSRFLYEAGLLERPPATTKSRSSPSSPNRSSPKPDDQSRAPRKKRKRSEKRDC